MNSTLLMYVALGGLAILLPSALVLWLHERGIRPLDEVLGRFRRLPRLAQIALLLFVVNLIVYGSTKAPTNGVDGAGSGTNAPPPMLAMGRPRPLPGPVVTSEDVARGWMLCESRTNEDATCYVLPMDATLVTNWWVRGAFEDVVRIGLGGLDWSFPFGTNTYSSLWAFSWGKIRFTLEDTNELVAVGAPMAAIPHRSRLWSAATTNDSFLVTWEDFAPGRDTNDSLNAQIEFFPSGLFIVRSNALESVRRTLDPDDWDGDGYLNVGDDPDPYVWNAGGDSYYGPHQELPLDCNTDVYYTVSVRISGSRSADVVFVGDGPSDLPDPSFRAKPGEACDVRLLIGKAYAVTSAAPLEVVGTSNWEVEVETIGENAYSIVWPVRIEDAPDFGPLLLLGAGASSGGSGSFSLWVTPDWLDGVFTWSSNNCCSVTGNGGPFDFTCGADCACGGCELSGRYTYAGYSIDFSGVHCGCRYESNDLTTFGLSVPDAVFKDGALRPMSVEFHHGDENDRERGSLVLTQLSGQDRIRVWRDANGTIPAGVLTWNVSSFDGCTLYIEGLESSDIVGDIRFRLDWNKPDGRSAHVFDQMTCAEVVYVHVGDQHFIGQVPHDFCVTNSPRPDQHAPILFKDVANTNDFSVNDFNVDMTLQVKPSGAPVGSASWFPLPPTPESAVLVSTGNRTGRLANPKEGGVYHIGAAFDGSPTNECNIVLPLAGAEMSEILLGDIAVADGFVSRSKANWPRRWYTRAIFASKWFTFDKYGYYRGRPDNADKPTVWFYNQVNDDSGEGAIGTLFGVPTYVEKMSNLLAAYTCECLGVPLEEQGLAERYGTPNDESAHRSWITGLRVAYNHDFVREIACLATNIYQWASQKSEKLWPNHAPVDNHRGCFGHGDFNVEFSSPGFIYCEQ